MSCLYVVLLICLTKEIITTFYVNTCHEHIEHSKISMIRLIVSITKGYELQVSNLLKDMKPCELCITLFSARGLTFSKKNIKPAHASLMFI